MAFLSVLPRRPVVSVLQLEGIIQPGGRVRTTGLSDATLAPMIEKAFRKGKPAAVALKINSPGGSPVQSSLISARIRRLADERNIPVYAFVEDLAASGGYWIASAADEIYVDPNSILGSIGVIYASFGFHELLKRSGIERRVHTAGTDKSLLDPFLPENPDHVERLKGIQEQMHAEFIDHVRTRRGERLNGDSLFTGRFWTGRTAVELGLADGIGHLVPKLKELHGRKVRFRHYNRRRQLLGSVGIRFADSLLDALEDRFIWARFGQ